MSASFYVMHSSRNHSIAVTTTTTSNQQHDSIQLQRDGFFMNEVNEFIYPSLQDIFSTSVLNKVLSNESGIPEPPMLTTDLRYYFNDAHVSLQRNKVYMNILRTYGRRNALRTFSNILKFHNYEFSSSRKYERDYYPDYSNRNELYCLFERLDNKYDPELYVVPAVAHAGSLTGHLECDIPVQISNKMKIDREQVRMVLVELYTRVPDIVRWATTFFPHRRNLQTPNLNEPVYRVLSKFNLMHPLSKVNTHSSDLQISDKFENQKILRPIFTTLALTPVDISKLKYITEWIEFHEMVGVEHFLIYCSDPVEENWNKFQQTLKYYIDNKIVTLIRWRFGITEYLNNLQLPAVMDANFRLMDLSEWLIVLDSDEYLVPMQSDSLVPILKKYIDSEAFELMALHTMFSTYQGQDPLSEDSSNIIQKYEYRGEIWPMNKKSKFIVRVGKFSDPQEVHSIIYSDYESDKRRIVLDPWQEIRLQHYYYSQRSWSQRLVNGKHQDPYFTTITIYDIYAREVFGEKLEQRLKLARNRSIM
jgi:hypothetical protein